jgi:hypothetical protein
MMKLLADRLNLPALLTIAAVLCVLWPMVVFAQVTSTRTTAYDWQCTNADGTKISDHQREGSAITACANLSLKDGKTRYVQGGRYRITAPSPVTQPPPPPPPPASGSALISWTPPTQNDNGTTLTNLAGYRIRYGKSATALDQTLQMGPGTVSQSVSGLAAGTWYFGVVAYNSNGVESNLSNTTTKTIP